MSPYNYSGDNPISHYDPQGSTDYNVGTEEDHETTTIDDGNKDISIYVTKNDLLKQQELWKKDDKLEYERNLDKLSYNNGFKTYEPYGALQYSLYYGMTFLPGLEVTYYAPGHKQYSDYAIEKQSPLYPITKGNEELLESLDKFSSYMAGSTKNNNFLTENVIKNITKGTKVMKSIPYVFDIGKIFAAYYYKNNAGKYYFGRTLTSVIASYGFSEIGSSTVATATTIVTSPSGVLTPGFVGAASVIGGSVGASVGDECGKEIYDYIYDNWWK